MEGSGEDGQPPDNPEGRTKVGNLVENKAFPQRSF
jgi:hypothetical protein